MPKALTYCIVNLNSGLTSVSVSGWSKPEYRPLPGLDSPPNQSFVVARPEHSTE